MLLPQNIQPNVYNVEEANSPGQQIPEKVKLEYSLSMKSTNGLLAHAADRHMGQTCNKVIAIERSSDALRKYCCAKTQ